MWTSLSVSVFHNCKKTYTLKFFRTWHTPSKWHHVLTDVSFHQKYIDYQSGSSIITISTWFIIIQQVMKKEITFRFLFPHLTSITFISYPMQVQVSSENFNQSWLNDKYINKRTYLLHHHRFLPFMKMSTE